MHIKYWLSDKHAYTSLVSQGNKFPSVGKYLRKGVACCTMFNILEQLPSILFSWLQGVLFMRARYQIRQSRDNVSAQNKALCCQLFVPAGDLFKDLLTPLWKTMRKTFCAGTISFLTPRYFLLPRFSIMTGNFGCLKTQGLE